MNKKESITLIIDNEIMYEISTRYKDYKVENKNEYIVFFAKYKKMTISIYKNKKFGLRATFIGEDAIKEAKQFDGVDVKIANKKRKAITNSNWINLNDQIGSDEVGTGDFFGPVCVCASYIKKEDIPYLKEMGVDDSKRLDDEKIKELGKILINKFPYSQVSLDNKKYNILHEKGINLNEMKAKMHNQVLLNLKNKFNVDNVFVDEFAKEETYYRYLNSTENVVKNITFKTKGESYYPSVAVSSIIARYSFLTKMEKLSEKYKMKIPFGASSKVDEFAKKFIKRYGLDELNKIVKKNFANYKKITE